MNHDLRKIGKLSIPSCSGVPPMEPNSISSKRSCRSITYPAKGTIETIVYLALPISLQQQ
ncbi:hypothetical protein O9992_00285 [Vibrio lentus]|nr:hypothetical protein [Vibrio lentus]